MTSEKIVPSKTKLLARSSALRIAQTIVGIAIGFLMMPFLINTLGEELYGLWIIIASLVGTYYLLDMGFSQAITRYVAQYIHQKNPDAASRVINTALVIYSCLGLIVLLASVIAAHFGVEALMGDSENVTLAQVILVVSGLSLALEFPAKSFPGIISAYLRYDVIAVVRLLKSLADAILIYLFLSNGYGLVAMAVISLFTGIASTLVYIVYANSLFKELRYSSALVDLTTFKDVFHFSKWVFVFEVNSTVRDKMDIWFIAFYQNSAVLTIYYVAIRLIEYAGMLLHQATGFTSPIFTEYYARGENQKLQDSVRAFIKISIALSSVFMVGFVLVGESFVRLWMGESFESHQAWICLVILSVGRLAVYISSPLQSLLMTLNQHKISAWLSVVETLASGILLWWLVPSYGIEGAAIAVTVPITIGRLIIIPLYVAPMVAIGFASLALRTTLFAMATFAAVKVARWSLPQLTSLSILELLFAASLIASIQLAIGLLLFNRSERIWIAQQLRRKRGA